MAEYRELPRIFGLARSAFERGEEPGENAPRQYTLGKGHVRFFYDKLDWLYHRQLELINEMKRRGFSPSYDNPFKFVEDIPYKMNTAWFRNWIPTEEAIFLNRGRIQERLESMKAKRVK